MLKPIAQEPTRHRLFVERLLIVSAFALLGFLLFRLSELILLVFGSVLVAVILRTIAGPLQRRTALSASLALSLSVVGLVAGLAGAMWWLGSEVRAQAQALGDTVPAAWLALEARIDEFGLGDTVDEWKSEITPAGSGILASVTGAVRSIGRGLADLLIVFVGGIYLAAQPELYRRGLLKLLPCPSRELGSVALDDSGRALKLWLLGQLVSMALVGTLTGVGLWLIGVPSPLALGLFAGLLEFIPLVGPIIAAIPGVLLAFAQSPEMALWALGLYLLIQQIEGNVIQPLVQQHAVDLPPALLLFSLLAGGLLFGATGVILATPLTVVIFVLTKRLYVREALATDTPLPGEE
jgi:predicted PurR-regulated permease PerM